MVMRLVRWHFVEEVLLQASVALRQVTRLKRFFVGRVGASAVTLRSLSDWEATDSFGNRRH